MALPRITIVTPSFNQGEYLEQTIQSVLSQNYPNLEYMIIDGGSNDTSVEIIRRYEKDLAYWRSHKDDGQTSAIMEGFQRASGDIIAWLNSDDYYEPGTLHLVAQTFQENKEALFVYGDYYVVRQNGAKILKKKVSCDFKVMAYSYLMIPQPSAFWDRRAYEAVGGLDRELKYVMDYDLFLRFAKTYPAKRFVHLRKPLSAFRLHPESKSVGSMAKFVPENKRVVARILPPQPEWQMKLLKYVFLLKLEAMYLFQRGYLPLHKDRTKA
ncbi:MAG TPA: glycosyltransferase family 2 protein [Edaphobacter sp.]